MNEKKNNSLLNLFQAYIIIEKEILKIVSEVSGQFCFKCQKQCCEEKICRESVDSQFLSSLIKLQNIQYDQKNGWMSPKGCRLSYGRPLVCYEFFCNKILAYKNLKLVKIQHAVKEFIVIGNRTRGNTHLICVDNLSAISLQKIFNISYQIEKLTEKLANQTVAAECMCSAA